MNTLCPFALASLIVLVLAVTVAEAKPRPDPDPVSFRDVPLDKVPVADQSVAQGGKTVVNKGLIEELEDETAAEDKKDPTLSSPKTDIEPAAPALHADDATMPYEAESDEQQSSIVNDEVAMDTPVSGIVSDNGEDTPATGVVGTDWNDNQMVPVATKPVSDDAMPMSMQIENAVDKTQDVPEQSTDLNTKKDESFVNGEMNTKDDDSNIDAPDNVVAADAAVSPSEGAGQTQNDLEFVNGNSDYDDEDDDDDNDDHDADDVDDDDDRNHENVEIYTPKNRTVKGQNDVANPSEAAGQTQNDLEFVNGNSDEDDDDHDADDVDDDDDRNHENAEIYTPKNITVKGQNDVVNEHDEDDEIDNELDENDVDDDHDENDVDDDDDENDEIDEQDHGNPEENDVRSTEKGVDDNSADKKMDADGNAQKKSEGMVDINSDTSDAKDASNNDEPTEEEIKDEIAKVIKDAMEDIEEPK